MQNTPLKKRITFLQKIIEKSSRIPGVCVKQKKRKK